MSQTLWVWHTSLAFTTACARVVGALTLSDPRTSHSTRRDITIDQPTSPLLQDETERLQQVTAERDEAVEAAKRSEAHVAALVGARNLSPAAGALLPSPAAAREPLQPLLQGSAEAGAVIPVPGESTGSDQLSRTALVHKLELTERRLREQAHEIRRMVCPRQMPLCPVLFLGCSSPLLLCGSGNCAGCSLPVGL